jgi:hypothetical protein
MKKTYSAPVVTASEVVRATEKGFVPNTISEVGTKTTLVL